MSDQVQKMGIHSYRPELEAEAGLGHQAVVRLAVGAGRNPGVPGGSRKAGEDSRGRRQEEEDSRRTEPAGSQGIGDSHKGQEDSRAKTVSILKSARDLSHAPRHLEGEDSRDKEGKARESVNSDIQSSYGEATRW